MRRRTSLGIAGDISPPPARKVLVIFLVWLVRGLTKTYLQLNNHARHWDTDANDRNRRHNLRYRAEPNSQPISAVHVDDQHEVRSRLWTF